MIFNLVTLSKILGTQWTPSMRGGNPPHARAREIGIRSLNGVPK